MYFVVEDFLSGYCIFPVDKVRIVMTPPHVNNVCMAIC